RRNDSADENDRTKPLADAFRRRHSAEYRRQSRQKLDRHKRHGGAGNQAASRSGGNAISISVPASGALLIRKCAWLASARALVNGRPNAVPPEPQLAGVRTSWNGSSAASMSRLLMPRPVSRTRNTASRVSENTVETMICP